ncbi:hypothetical protein D9619_002664 [Psilocybe cf. subviscida]|uniref:Uncharacterized protein n=1 Tax=Psilocybe cf. subviscida TaxID=2480587 RepID=A0A8H5AY60_9AGAR|nr:hypothetical protein D9619_002664 [Psilocybe cf. subviscida]
MWLIRNFYPFTELQRGGAIAWAVLLAPMLLGGTSATQIYGGIGIGVAAAAVISMFALSNRSYIWIRVAKFLWPFIIVIAAVRAIIMIVQLQRGKDNITWECNNGGVLWTPADSTTTIVDDTTIPGGFCTLGFASLNTAFIVSLLVDLIIQL